MAGADGLNVAAAQALVVGVASPASRVQELQAQRRAMAQERAALLREENKEKKKLARLMVKARSLSNEQLLQIVASRVSEEAKGKGKGKGKKGKGKGKVAVVDEAAADAGDEGAAAVAAPDAGGDVDEDGGAAGPVDGGADGEVIGAHA